LKSPFSLSTALGLYAALAAMAGWLLSGEFRLAIWIFLGGLAVKTWIAGKRRALEDREDPAE
jgi:hypothetical protein